MSRGPGHHPGSDALRQWQTLQLSKLELELQQQALSALQQSSEQAQAGQALYQRLFDQSPACSYALDQAGRVVCANQAGAALLAQGAAAMQGQPFERYLAPDEQPRWRAFVAVLAGGEGRAGMDAQLFAGIPGACGVRIEARRDAACGLYCVVMTPQGAAVDRELAERREQAAFDHALQAAEQLSARLEAQAAAQGAATVAAQVAERTAALERDNALLRQQLGAHAEAERGLRLAAAQLRLLAEHDANALEAARLDMARTMHDDVAQNLLALRLEAALLNERASGHDGPLRRRAGAALDNVDATLRAVRAILNQLRPAVLELGLQAAIDWLLAEFRKRSGLVCTLDVPDEDVFHCLDGGTALMLFRQLQLALESVQRDAGASAVAVSLRRTGGTGVQLLLTDDGAGDAGSDAGAGGAAASGRRQRQALAMLAIGERLRARGGTLDVDYGASQGCRISMRLLGRHS